MMIVSVSNEQKKQELLDAIVDNDYQYTKSGFSILVNDKKFVLAPSYRNIDLNIAPKKEQTQTNPYSDPVIFGKNPSEQIVSLIPRDDVIHVKYLDGKIEVIPNKKFVLTPFHQGDNTVILKGNQHYKYAKVFTDDSEFRSYVGKLKRQDKDYYTIWDAQESNMVTQGYTLFKGLRFEQVPVLAFDIESTGVAHDDTSMVLIITNTYRDQYGNITRKLFVEDEYESQKDLIEAWCRWVVEIDPVIITGHNINGYDIPYIQFCYEKSFLDLGLDYTQGLPLGLYAEPIKIANKSTEKRVDGSNTWSYKKITCEGRHIVDGMFLAVMYDIGRNYESWGLKPIIDYEVKQAISKKDKGQDLSKVYLDMIETQKDRTFYDASKIGRDWFEQDRHGNYYKRDEIIAYGKDDSDDSLHIWDLMGPSTFYMTQSIPKPYQKVTESASGSWINSMLIRSYLQFGYSIPKADEPSYVHGGISFGIAGMYKNVFKLDISGLYPSVIRQFKLYSKRKDIYQNYLKSLEYFTLKRLEYKKLHKQTKEKYYEDMQLSYKTLVNSYYGTTSTKGLNFNDYDLGNKITGLGRVILRETMKYFTGKDVDFWWKKFQETTGSKTEYNLEKDIKYNNMVKI